MKHGVQINLDNEHELAMVHNLLETECKGSKSTFGLRLNPSVGGGRLAFTSTATKASKFGLPITKETRSIVKSLYLKYTFLTSVHFHVGSQGVPLELFIKGAKVSLL